MQNSSMDEFEKLEQQCSNPSSNPQSKIPSVKPAAQQQNKTHRQTKQRKLFDSSSEESQNEDEQHKSDLVKKMFYKEQQQPSTQQQLKAHPLQPQSDLPEHMQAAVDKKVLQLDQAITQYNAEHDQLKRKQAEFEQLTRKLKLEQRDLDQQRRRLLEDVEKQKAVEHEKL